MAVAQHHPLGHSGESFLDEPGWDAQAVPITHMGAGVLEKIDCLLLIQPHASAFHDLQAG
jgi:hypothetical protein